MDFKISGQQRLMIASVRDLVEAEFKPNALTNNELQVANIRFKPKS